MFNHILTLSLCIQETPKWVLLQTVKTQMKLHIMWHFISVYTGCRGKKIFRQKIQYNLTLLDIYNGPSQVHCIKPEGRIH